jgi:hypothetical protein
VHGGGFVSESWAVSAYIVEIQAVVLRGDGPIGYGVDDLGRPFSVALDLGLATSVAAALDLGRRPIVAVEQGHATREQRGPGSLSLVQSETRR